MTIVLTELMRRVLVLGGTAWLGREIVNAALSDGADVVCLARGESGDVPDGARLVRADRTQPGAYDALDGDWDEVIELAYQPSLVEPALDALADRARHWTLISSVSVYLHNDTPGADETAETVEPVDLNTYADAKVAAERSASAHLADRLLIARPGLIVGPGDATDRFGYWPARLHRGGRVLTPVAAGRFAQVIDVADLAAWTVAAGGLGSTGIVNAVGASRPFGALLAEIGEVAGFNGELVAADDADLIALGVQHWAGPTSLPLWLPAAEAAFAQRDNSAYLASGGILRPLRETIAGVLSDEVSRGIERPRRSGLVPQIEAALLDQLHP